MGLTEPIFTTPRAYLKSREPDQPTFFFAPHILAQTARRFQRGFGGLVSYAIKANPDIAVLDNLLAAGITTFDVASLEEIRMVRARAPQATLHYHNPVRSGREISGALQSGVRSFSIDRMSELEKLAQMAQGRPLEVSVRLKLPVKGAAYDFGTKFGATPDEAVELLQRVRDLGFTPSMTFHPGTQCKSASAWQRYIDASAQVSHQAQTPLYRLNIGGGFPSHRNGQPPDLRAIFDMIRAATAKAFAPNPPKLVCEPGRAMVAEAYSLATRIRAVDARGNIFLNDGIYGGLAEYPVIEATDRITALSQDGQILAGPTSPKTLFGPTCDSLDVLHSQHVLPDTLAEGDYLIFHGMGAYSCALSTRFNGYGQHKVVNLSKPS
ncbi:MAG: type III PLP-dependent enzyme [Alphaproteobacteria bacterium]|nr:type III PLP-dependent enzyme [Alphaproteobacteria bacterium]